MVKGGTNVADKCCNPKCKGQGQPSWNGLCGKCYKEAKGMIHAGRTTWTDLQRLGLAKLKTESGSLIEAFEERARKHLLSDEL